MRGLALSLLAIVALPALSGCKGSSSGNNTTSSSAASSSSGGDTGGGGSGGGSSSASSGNGGQFMPGQAITAPDSTWTWVPFPDAFCASGDPVGLGINLSTTSTRVLIYLEGGGACWDKVTCFDAGTAAFIDTPYTSDDFTQESTSTDYLAKPGGFFDRTDVSNPFKDYSYVYVPYCTGDVHGGSNVVMYGDKTVHHVGRENISAFLKRIVPTFATAERVMLAGSSAGGFGAALNLERVQKAFNTVPVDLFDDSGTPMPADIQVSYEDDQDKSWNLKSGLPVECTDCQKHLDALLPYYAAKYPTQRLALASYTKDTVLPTLFNVSTDDFGKGLQEDVTNLASNTNFGAFVKDDSGHVLWFSPDLASNGTPLRQWIAAMVQANPQWKTINPVAANP